VLRQLRLQFCIRSNYSLSFVTQVPSYGIDYESRTFRPDCHVRSHRADEEAAVVRTYLWPALREGKNGPVVHKAVVIT